MWIGDNWDARLWTKKGWLYFWTFPKGEWWICEKLKIQQVEIPEAFALVIKVWCSSYVRNFLCIFSIGILLKPQNVPLYFFKLQNERLYCRHRYYAYSKQMNITYYRVLYIKMHIKIDHTHISDLLRVQKLTYVHKRFVY